MYVCVNRCIYIYICVCVCVFIYVYIPYLTAYKGQIFYENYFFNSPESYMPYVGLKFAIASRN